MSRLVDYMKEAKIFYLATAVDNKPDIRPVGGKPGFDGEGFVVSDGKIYLYTDNRKSMYKQMVANPSIALNFMVPKGFVRVAAEAVFEDNTEVKKTILSENPVLTNLYKEDDGVFEVYYLDHVDAHLHLVGQDPVTID